MDGSRWNLPCRWTSALGALSYGDPATPPAKGHSPQFSAQIRYGQMAGWIKMPLGMEDDLGPGDFALDGDPCSCPSQKGSGAPQFSAHVYCGQTAGWIKMALGTEVGSGPGPIVLNGDPAVPFLGGAGSPAPTQLPEKGHSPHVYCGHTITHLSYC